MSPPSKKRKIVTKNLVDLTLNSINKNENDLPELWENFNLSEPILQALSSLQYSNPTKIQSQVIPLAFHQGYDIIGAAETGSGKTLAFAIPIVEKWLKLENKDFIFAIIITPTRELSLQITEEISKISKFIDEPRFRCITLFGGLSQQKQERLLKKKPHVIVATPGRLWSLIDQGYLDELHTVKILVVDEIDRMLEKGHFEELEHIVTRVQAEVQQNNNDLNVLQTMIFSATLTFTHVPVMRNDGTFTKKQTSANKINNIVGFMNLRNKRKTIDLTPKNIMPATLIECRMHCSNLKEKDSNLYYLLNRYSGKTIVFANSINCIRRIYNLLNTLEHKPKPCILHAKINEKQRLKNLEKFSESDNAVLLASDVAARGLDIKDVSNVIHYQCPKTSEAYVHRSGRTARASKSGFTILFVDSLDIQFYARIKKNLQWEKDLDLLIVDDKPLMDVCSYRVDLASQVESTEYNLKKVSTRNVWFKQMAEEADLILSDDLIDKNDENGINESPQEIALRQKRKKLIKGLNAILKKPLPKSNSTDFSLTALQPAKKLNFKAKKRSKK